jgi:ADP-ribose pyrophosphatase YjhB (NUDIX family)
MYFRFPDDVVPGFCTKCGGPIVNAEEEGVSSFLISGDDRKPFLCTNGHEVWLSPSPVSVLALFVDRKAVLTRRLIHPVGELCLAGGHDNPGEDSVAAAIREARQEIAFEMPGGTELIHMGHRASPVRPVGLNCWALHWETRKYGPCELKPDGKEVSEIVYVEDLQHIPPLAFDLHRTLLIRAAHRLNVIY